MDGLLHDLHKHQQPQGHPGYPGLYVFHAGKDVAAIQAAYSAKYGKDCRCGSGYIYSGCNGDALNITRALGDTGFTLVRKPQVKTYTAAPRGTVLMLASDGILTEPGAARRCIKGYVDRMHQGKHVAEIGGGIQYQHDNTTIVGIRFSAQ